MEDLPKDGWGNEFKYELMDDGNGGTGFNVTSAGENGSFDGTDNDDIDIYVKQ